MGKLFSDVNFDIYRPSYSASDQTGTLIASNKSVRFDTRAAQWAEPALGQGMYYDLFLNRDLIQSGDILVPTGLSPTASTISQYPIITVESISAMKPCVGLLTDHLGNITEGQNTVRYANVRWQWAAKGTPRKSNVDSRFEDLLPWDKRQVIMYRRQQTGQPYPILAGMRLVETVDGRKHLWRILDVYSTGNFTTMQVEEDST
jgi:hypothetical protein